MIASKRIIPVLGLKYISDADIAPFTDQRITNLTEHASAFPGLNPSIADLSAALSQYRAALAETGVNGNPSATQAKNNWRKQLDYMLMQCALSCAAIADSEATFLLSGFRVKNKGSRTTSLETPTNLHFKHGPVDGSVYAFFMTVKNAGSYEVRVGKDSNDQSLTIVNTNKGCKILITDLQSLSIYYGKCRAIGSNNIKSAWSPVVQFKVL